MFDKAEYPKVKAAFVLKIALYLNAPAYLFKEALQVISGRYSAAYLFREIIEVKRIIKLILEAFNSPRLKILPAIHKYPESLDSLMPGRRFIDMAGLLH